MSKIIQIIPAPTGLVLMFSTGKEKGQRQFSRPALCLALVEDDSGEREVVFLYTDHEGDILSTADPILNFIGVFPYNYNGGGYQNL